MQLANIALELANLHPELSDRHFQGRVARMCVLLQAVDQGQLPLHQGLRPAGEVDEQVVDVVAEHGLLDGQPQRLLVHRVEGAGDLPDLLVGVDRHGRHRGLVRRARVLGDLRDRVGRLCCAISRAL